MPFAEKVQGVPRARHALAPPGVRALSILRTLVHPSHGRTVEVELRDGTIEGQCSSNRDNTWGGRESGVVLDLSSTTCHQEGGHGITSVADPSARQLHGA